MPADASLHILSFDRLARSVLRHWRYPDLAIATLFQRSSYLDIAGPRSGKHTVREVPLTRFHH